MKYIRFFFRAILLVFLLLVTAASPFLTSAQTPVTDEENGSPAVEEVTPDLSLESAALNRAFSSGPQYDSGWVGLSQNESRSLIHNLGGNVDAYIVDMQYRGSDDDGINLRYYGGADFGTSPAPGHAVDDRVGAYWRSLNTTSIIVYRRPEDTYAQQVRIRIWVDASPDYTSGWVSIAPNETKTLTHPLGGNVDDYVVDMQFKSATSGINQRYYGGSDYGSKIEIGTPNDRVGAYWRTLTNAQITVYRRPEDTFAEQVRIRIWKRPVATYDSGWVPINQDAAIPLDHDIGGSVSDYQIVMDFKAPDENGINQRACGGMDAGTHPSSGLAENARVGAYWRSLSPTSIIIYRRPQDTYAPQVRIRIFRFWHVPPPNYDSGWRAISTDGALYLPHNLGGDANTYIVDMQYRSSSVDGINQRYHGGADFGTSPAPGHVAEDRVGAYWRNLTSTSITVYRRPEDSYAPDVRIRIWRMPKPDYNSGWLSRSPGEASTLTHNLLGDYQDDYFVYFDYSNSIDGINQRYYGGADFGSKSFEGASNNDRTGAYWHKLTNTTVSTYRSPEDTYAQQLRLRIWRISPPTYNSGWISLAEDEAAVLEHNLGGRPEGYLVQMYQWDSLSENLLNQRHYGGNDFGTLPPTLHLENDRVGSYWRSLTNHDLVVYRRPEDTYADYVLVRIWYYSLMYLPIITR